MDKELYKIVVYNYLFKFTKVEKLLKDMFVENLNEVVDEEIKNDFIFLHLAEKIKKSILEDISESTLKIEKMIYPKKSKLTVEWNLKKRINFALKHNIMEDVLRDVDHFQKRENIAVQKLLDDAVSIRNILAHETHIKSSRSSSGWELLSNELLKKMMEADEEFNGSTGLSELDDKYKHALTYYFYLKEIESRFP